MLRRHTQLSRLTDRWMAVYAVHVSHIYRDTNSHACRYRYQKIRHTICMLFEIHTWSHSCMRMIVILESMHDMRQGDVSGEGGLPALHQQHLGYMDRPRVWLVSGRNSARLTHCDLLRGTVRQLQQELG